MPQLAAAQVSPGVPEVKTIVAGPQFDRSSLHQWLWGKHYRKEWNTPVALPLFYLDTAAGGLRPYQAGGGMQSRTLRLRNTNNREFVLRSIEKTFGRALPQVYRGTFVEKIINDQASIAHPYAAPTVAPMAEAAGILHTWPSIVYVPQQQALDSFNKDYGDAPYLFEQRPDENWEEAPNFAHSKDIISTETVFEKLRSSALHRADQRLYVRSRLFDMFVGDWGRHEDQWRWATVPVENGVVYKPVPRDRDQTYTRFDGFLLKLARSAAGLGHLQTFDHTIRDVARYNFPARYLDRQMANEPPKEEWLETARELQSLLTDSVIAAAVRLLPPEVFPISGPEIIAKLKSRRNRLEQFASEYYHFLAKEVELVGTTGADIFELLPQQDGTLEVHAYAAKEDGSKGTRYYLRRLLPGETEEIRVFGLDGNDVYTVGGGNSSITIRLVGGPQNDSYTIDGGTEVHIYDSRNQTVHRSAAARLHLSSDTAVHRYQYDAFVYDKKGISPTVFYSREDRIYAGISYKATDYKWRRSPFASKHELFVRYSFNQNAFNLGYEAVVHQFMGKWSLLVNGTYDWVRWTNFFGLGNETEQLTNDRDFYRIRSQDGLGYLGFRRGIGKQSSITITPFYETIKLLKDTGRFLIKQFYGGNGSHQDFIRKHFTGAGIELDLRRWNDLLVPSRGISFFTTARQVYNIRDEKHFTSIYGSLQIFLPLARWLTLSVNNGAATVQGEPEFYQLNAIGGNLLRGYRRERFWGHTTFHNNNELQWLFNVRGRLFNGRMGFTAFADQGRVWLKGETSDQWHYGYGGGLVLVPFNRLFISVQYGISKDDKVIHLNFRRAL